MNPAQTIIPDLAAIKRRQQQTWAGGDFGGVGARIVLVAEQLCDAADLRAGWHVLDVATGSGNAAIAAARLGCTAVGVDYVPALLEQGRRRATPGPRPSCCACACPAARSRWRAGRPRASSASSS